MKPSRLKYIALMIVAIGLLLLTVAFYKTADLLSTVILGITLIGAMLAIIGGLILLLSIVE